MEPTTLVFTDIEESTQLWERHPNAFLAALARHDAIIQECLAAHEGREVKRLGDGLFLRFLRPSRAFEFALDVHDRISRESWPELAANETLKIRIGIHYGDPHNIEDDLLGLPVNRAARLCAAGNGGQTLVSEQAYDEVRERIIPNAKLEFLGRFRLRGFSRFEAVYQLSDSRKRATFPPLRANSISLPAEPNAFFGREEILSYLERLLTGSQTRLVTLTGMGGMGKSRTALHLAHRLVPDFEGGIYFVELAPLSHVNEVLPLVMRSLGAAGNPDDPPVRVISELLDNQRTLIVLDNLEHLEGIERVVTDLIAGCPSVRILATSRVVLQTWRQQEVDLPPLDVPSPQQSLSQIRRAESVKMFAKRAKSFDRSFQLTESNASSVASICGLTAGIPLAIEIASQLIQVYDVAGIASRLQGTLLEIEARTPDLPDRLRSLYTAFEYSYRLLPPDRRELLACLLTFRGGFTVEAVEAVAVGSPDNLDTAWKGLLDHRWVERSETPYGRRYRMLEPVVDFVRDKAGAPSDRALAAHAAYYLSVAQEVDRRFRSREIKDSFHRLREDLDNFRSALRWSCNAGQHETAARLGAYLSNILLDAGLWEEFESWVGMAIRSAEIISHGPLLSQLMTVKGLMAERRGDPRAATSYFEQSLQYGEDSDRDLLRAHINLARMSQESGDTDRCAKHAEQVRVIAPRCGMRPDAGLGSIFLAFIRECDGEIHAADRLWDEAREGFEQAGDDWGLAHWDRERGRAKERLGALQAARRYYGSCLRRYSRLGLPQQMTIVMGRLAMVAARQNDFQVCARTLAIANGYTGSQYYEVKVLSDVAREMRERVGEKIARQLLEEAAGSSLQELLEDLESDEPERSSKWAVVRVGASF
jgi:predicted ATPase/class 3 adenylate cyclase